MRKPTLRSTAPLLTLLCAAALTACGGGDDTSPTATPATTETDATSYTADATMLASDATTVLDAGVQTAQAVVAAQAALPAGARPDTRALAAQALATSDTQVSCPGGGTATLTITGGTDDGMHNGRFDTGEAYTLVYADCAGAAGALVLNGTMALTVNSATDNDLSLSLVVTDLSAMLPRGMATLAGSTTHSRSTAIDADGATVLTSHVVTPSMTLMTSYNQRSSSFALSDVDVTRQSVWLDGVLQSSSIDGTHSLSATLPNRQFSFTVATVGGVTYGADGTPATGTWTITLPNSLLGVVIANEVATVTVDEGKDGSIDRTFTVPIGNLRAAAG